MKELYDSFYATLLQQRSYTPQLKSPQPSKHTRNYGTMSSADGPTPVCFRCRAETFHEYPSATSRYLPVFSLDHSMWLPSRGPSFDTSRLCRIRVLPRFSSAIAVTPGNRAGNLRWACPQPCVCGGVTTTHDSGRECVVAMQC